MNQNEVRYTSLPATWPPNSIVFIRNLADDTDTVEASMSESERTSVIIST